MKWMGNQVIFTGHLSYTWSNATSWYNRNPRQFTFPSFFLLVKLKNTQEKIETKNVFISTKHYFKRKGIITFRHRDKLKQSCVNRKKYCRTQTRTKMSQMSICYPEKSLRQPYHTHAHFSVDITNASNSFGCPMATGDLGCCEWGWFVIWQF